MKEWRVYTWGPTGAAIAETVVAEGVDFEGGAAVFYRNIVRNVGGVGVAGRELVLAFSPSRWTEIVPVA